MISAERNTIQMYLTQPQATDEFNPWMFPELAAKILFLGGLPLETRRTDLVALLSLFSEVVWLSMALDRVTGGFKGYAFTLLADDEKSRCLLQKKTIDFMGVKVGVLRWKASCDYINDKDSNLKKKVFLKGLEVTVDDAELYQYFSKFGTVEFAEVRRDHLTKQSRRIGFILFEKEASASSCLAKKNHYLKNRRIHCKPCKSKKEKEQLQEEYLNNRSESWSERLSEDPSHAKSSISNEKFAILGTQGINMSAVCTPQKPLEVTSKHFSSPQESLSVLDDPQMHQHGNLEAKVSKDDPFVIAPIGFCAHRSDYSISTASNEGLPTPRGYKSRGDLSRLLFSQPYVPSPVDELKPKKKPIQIEYFTLPGNF